MNSKAAQDTRSEAQVAARVGTSGEVTAVAASADAAAGAAERAVGMTQPGHSRGTQDSGTVAIPRGWELGASTVGMHARTPGAGKCV